MPENNFQNYKRYRYSYFQHSPTKYDKYGYDIRGFDKNGIHKITGMKYDLLGFDVNGIHGTTGTKFDPHGHNVEWYMNRLNKNQTHYNSEEICVHPDPKYIEAFFKEHPELKGRTLFM